MKIVTKIFTQLLRFALRPGLRAMELAQNFYYAIIRNSLNPLHPNISVQILHTFLCIFYVAFIRRICQTIKSFFSW